MEVLEIIRGYLGTFRENVIIEGQSKYLSLWEAEYKGFNPDFHKYSVYRNDGTYVDTIKKSFKGAKLVAGDWANMIANEKTYININEADQEKLDVILDANNFWQSLNLNYELAMALSISSAIITIEDLSITDEGKLAKRDGKLKINFLKAKQIYPITIENKVITECAFACDNTNYVNLVIYLKNDAGIYEIHNLKCKKNNAREIMTPDFKNIRVFNTMSNKRWFTCFRPALANNLDLNSDLPISVYANSIDTLHALDNKYDGFDSEYALGKRRIFVSGEYMKQVEYKTDDGTAIKYVPVFDNNDVVFYNIPNNDNLANNGGSRDIKVSAEPLRAQDYISGINQELTYLSKQCGFGLNRWVFDAGGRPLQTATSVISQNSELYQNLRKHEIVLEQELRILTEAIIEASNNFTDIKFGDNNDVVINFDDSIIEDTEAQQTRDRNNVQAGLMSETDFVAKWFGKNSEDAEKYILDNLRWKKLNNYASAYQMGLISTELLMQYCYPDIKKDSDEYNVLLEYLESNKASASPLSDFNNMYNEQ